MICGKWLNCPLLGHSPQAIDVLRLRDFLSPQRDEVPCIRSSRHTDSHRHSLSARPSDSSRDPASLLGGGQTSLQQTALVF